MIKDCKKRRTVFYLSDRTGITVETLGHSLLTQFDGIQWRKVSIPFLDSEDKAKETAEQINMMAELDGCRPLVFSTLVNPEVRQYIESADCAIYDFFNNFIDSMEKELGQPSSHAIGRSHGLHNDASYSKRISAINFAQASDDGISAKSFAEADIILIGVSRSGKTPTCLYLAMQYGIYAANYPLTEEDMQENKLPELLKPFRPKLFGLTIEAEQLQRIRQERKPNSRYASFNQCEQELEWQQNLYRRENIPCINTTAISIEEIATTILNRSGLKRQLYGE
ncbi:pyruvate, water dikinase regulatory protein [Candidatus Thiothrix sp. Deng01]|uniref:Putative phosphoenolpyruvate synthase regulatory protein n=1 Tax=Candidatus Thiothrix phosphatis TaxID=3112415 RepID=A0ABU6CZM2_9GAMM|nr:pyruvate, water dikinase regulatory protein [Candidatus Thiothrix sp. Deng01]MEB4592286.1 pyruvate, water dikinase regulatory protein [Candidatus Thiothrix sp. Deng01]